MKRVWVVKIRDRNNRLLAFDVPDLIKALRPTTDGMVWAVNIWDWEGEKDALPVRGIQNAVLSTAELLDIYQGICQTCEAELFGFSTLDPTEKTEVDCPELREFTGSKASIGIAAFDSSYFVLLTKDYADVEAIKKRFTDAVEEDAANWFDL